jgi:hypothetical protein
MIERASADVICTGRQLGEVIGVTQQQVERQNCFFQRFAVFIVASLKTSRPDMSRKNST